MITAVGVVVPARNEQDSIGACLRSVQRALQSLPADVAVAVAVVLDRCSDETSERVAVVNHDWPELEVLVVGGNGPLSVQPTGAQTADVGMLRSLGLSRALARLRPRPTDRTWLLSTDADTTVPTDWVCEHLRLAAGGAHGVAGLAELDGEAHLSSTARERYGEIVASGVQDGSHDHVYCANLGFRADAYLAVAGFPVGAGPGEDHGLWRRMAAAGYRLEHPTSLRVRTSGRLHGRAEGGLADLLLALQQRGHARSAENSEVSCVRTPAPVLQ